VPDLRKVHAVYPTRYPGYDTGYDTCYD